MSTKWFLAAIIFGFALALAPAARAEEHGGAEHKAAEGEHKEGPEARAEGFEVKVRDTGGEFQVPAKIWDLLLGVSAEGEKKEGAKKEGGEGGPAPELTTASFLYAPVEVELKEKNPGVLRQPVIVFKIAEGGSEIDLAKWLTGKTGSFSVKFILEGAANPESEAKAFFYSRARKRRVGDQIIGSGCKQFMDLSSFLLDPKSEPLMVNTTRNFHDSVLGGHFLFSWKSEGSRRVTRVSFNDTANPQYFCGNEK